MALKEIVSTAIGVNDIGQVVYLANGTTISRDDFNTLCLARIAAALEFEAQRDDDDDGGGEAETAPDPDDIFHLGT